MQDERATLCKCAVCGANEREVWPCRRYLDTLCSPCTKCTVGKHVGKKCAGKTDTACKTCSYGKFMADKVHYKTECAPCSKCGAGKYVSRSCSASRGKADTVCSSCAYGKFQAALQHSSTACKPWTKCPVGAVDFRGSSTKDRTCKSTTTPATTTTAPRTTTPAVTTTTPATTTTAPRTTTPAVTTTTPAITTTAPRTTTPTVTTTPVGTATPAGTTTTPSDTTLPARTPTPTPKETTAGTPPAPPTPSTRTQTKTETAKTTTPPLPLSASTKSAATEPGSDTEKLAAATLPTESTEPAGATLSTHTPTDRAAAGSTPGSTSAAATATSAVHSATTDPGGGTGTGTGGATGSTDGTASETTPANIANVSRVPGVGGNVSANTRTSAAVPIPPDSLYTCTANETARCGAGSARCLPTAGGRLCVKPGGEASLCGYAPCFSGAACSTDESSARGFRCDCPDGTVGHNCRPLLDVGADEDEGDDGAVSSKEGCTGARCGSALGGGPAHNSKDGGGGSDSGWWVWLVVVLILVCASMAVVAALVWHRGRAPEEAMAGSKAYVNPLYSDTVSGHDAAANSTYHTGVYSLALDTEEQGAGNEGLGAGGHDTLANSTYEGLGAGVGGHDTLANSTYEGFGSHDAVAGGSHSAPTAQKSMVIHDTSKLYVARRYAPLLVLPPMHGRAPTGGPVGWPCSRAACCVLRAAC